MIWQLFRPDRRCLQVLLLVSLFQSRVTLAQQQPQAATTLAELQQQLTDHTSSPRFAGAMWGIKVVSLDGSKILFEHNTHKLFSPASNSKLFTVALALERLGKDYRIKTSLYAKAKPAKTGVLKGDLVVYGRGDPTINGRLHGDDIYKALQPLVAAITNAGVRRISGDLVADESYFRGPPFGSGWAWDDMEYYYGAEISALTISDNTLQVSVLPGERVGARCKLTLSPPTDYITFSNRTETIAKGGRRRINFHRPINENVVYVSGQMPLEEAVYKDDVTVHQPAGLFLAFLKEALGRNGVRVGGKVRVINWLNRQGYEGCEHMVELGSVESLPLSDIAREVMKPSQNLYTDLLLAHVGERSRDADTPAERTSEDLGVRELEEFAQAVGIKRGELLFEEGSGLSRNNLVTPEAIVTLLQFAHRQPYGQVYLNSLPVAGVDGTLRNRMKGTPAAGNVRAKTGTLRWANSLSGHVTTAAGERLLFCIMLNRYYSTDPTKPARPELDAVANMLAGFKGKAAGP